MDVQEDPTGSTTSRKRKRQIVSCIECRRRKIRCDRVVPCGPCVRRNEGALCHSDMEGSSNAMVLEGLLLNAKASGSEVFAPASSSVVSSLAERVAFLERTLLPRLINVEKLVASGGANLGEPTAPNQLAVAPLKRDVLVPNSMSLPDSEPGSGEDVEDALLALESLAVQTGLPTTYKFGRDHNSTTSPSGSPTKPSPADVQSPPYPFSPVVRPWDGGSIKLSKTVPVSSIHAGGPMLPDPINYVLRLLPERSIVFQLLSSFYANISWQWHVLHGPAMKLQVSQFFAVVDSLDTARVDPAWLSTFCALVCLGADALSYSERVQLGWSDEEQKEMAARWFAASQYALMSSDWFARPQVRALQTVLLLVAYLGHDGRSLLPFTDFTGRTVREDGVGLETWLAPAVQTARRLKIDQLGTNGTSMPIDDCGWPVGESSAKREIGVRLWTLLVYVDRKVYSTNLDRSMIPIGSYSTGSPTRCDDIDLGVGLEQVTPSAHHHAFSDADVLLYYHCLSNLLARIQDTKRQGKQLQYSTALELDSNFRSLAAQLFGGESTAPCTGNDIRRELLRAGVQNRLLRIHRPFFLQSSGSTSHSLSRHTCLLAARAIISIYTSESTYESKWCSIFHSLGAATVLHLEQLHSVSLLSSIPPIDTDDEAKLEAVHQMLLRVHKNPFVTEKMHSLAFQAGKVVSGLADVRRSGVPPRSATSVLQQVATKLVSESGSPLGIDDGTTARGFGTSGGDVDIEGSTSTWDYDQLWNFSRPQMAEGGFALVDEMSWDDLGYSFLTSQLPNQ